MKKLLGLCLTVLFLSTPLLATSSLSGPTGLVTIPTAEALKYKEFSMAFDYILDEDVTDHDDWRYNLNIGTFQNIELGVIGGKTPTEGVFLNVKYYLTGPSDERFPLALAIGAQNISSDSDTNIYMMGSKKLRQDFGIHFGFKAIFTETEIKPAVMTGTDFVVNEHIKILADIDGDGDIYTLNAGVELFLTEAIAVKGSLVDISEATDNGRAYSFGISFNKFL